VTVTYKKACVTGGAGFIGSHLTNALLQAGLGVTVLDNLSVGSRDRVSSEAIFIEGDILDEVAVKEAVSGCDIVFHLAARVAIRSSFKFVVEDMLANASGSAMVLKHSCLEDSVKKIITTSSMAVYADSPAPVPVAEDYLLKPLSPYGISKLATEQLTYTMCDEAGKDSAVLRLFNTYGRGQVYSPYVGVVTIFVNKILKGKSPVIFSDGEQKRDFVHVSDVVTGYLAAMNSDVSGEAFNIGSGVPVSINQVLSYIQNALDTELEAEYQDAVKGEVRYSIADISKAGSLLGYYPEHSFDTSVKDVVNEIIEHSQ